MAVKRPPVPRPNREPSSTVVQLSPEIEVEEAAETTTISRTYRPVKHARSGRADTLVTKPRELPRLDNYGRPVSEYLDPEDQAESAEKLHVPSRRVPDRKVTRKVDRSLIGGRGILLVLVIIVAFVMVAPSIRLFVEQRVAVSELEKQIAAEKTELADKQAELRDWQNPEYVKQQARDRLQYVMPGETSYIVVDEEQVPGSQDKVGDGLRSSEKAVEAMRQPTWYEQLWQSVEVAGQ